MPISPENGTVITVKNINAGGNSVFVQTNGIDNMETEAGTIRQWSIRYYRRYGRLYNLDLSKFYVNLQGHRVIRVKLHLE